MILKTHCTRKCLEEFVIVGGMRLLRLWTQEYERKNDLRSLSQIADMCCSIPLNQRTKAAITDSGIPKCIKRLKKMDYNDSALKCMHIWQEANTRLQRLSATPRSIDDTKKPEASTLVASNSSVFLEVKDIITERRNTYCAERCAEQCLIDSLAAII